MSSTYSKKPTRIRLEAVPFGRPPVPVGAAMTSRSKRFSSSEPWTQSSAALWRVDRFDPTTWDILAIAAGTDPVRRRLDTPLQKQYSTTFDLASRFPGPIAGRWSQAQADRADDEPRHNCRPSPGPDNQQSRTSPAPADKFVKLALRYQSEIRVYYNGNQFNGKSILDLTTLAAECGTRLELEACGPDAVEALDALADLVAANFYENEIGDTIQEQSNPEPGR